MRLTVYQFVQFLMVYYLYLGSGTISSYPLDLAYINNKKKVWKSAHMIMNNYYILNKNGSHICWHDSKKIFILVYKNGNNMKIGKREKNW